MGRQGTTRSDVPHEGISRRIGAYASAHRLKRRWLAVLSVLAAVVVCATAYALTLPASTMTGAASLPAGAQVPEGYTRQYSAQDNASGVAVTVHAAEGVVPEGAELKVSMLQQGDEAYVAAEQELAAQARSADEGDYGFAAMDIRFEDVEGNEVEPAGDVYVVIDAESILPEDADPESVTVQHHAEKDEGVVVEAVADAVDATDGVVATEDAAVQAAFAVDGFSTFTITWTTTNWWGGSEDHNITIHCVDESGTEIGEELSDIKQSEEITISENAPVIEGYTFDHAKVAQRADREGNSFTRLRYSSGFSSGWEYGAQGYWGVDWRSVGNNNIYLVYSLNPVELTTVDTVDSASEGVHMYMFDYNTPAFNDEVGGYGEGDTKEGLLQRTLNANGWPVFSADRNVVTDGELRGRSLATYFGGSSNAYSMSGSLNNSGREVNHLFRLDRFQENGTFYYSSFDTFATLKNDNDNSFTVYNQLGTPSNEIQYFYQRGNFMPYNTLNSSDVRNHNLYDEYGQNLTGSDSRYNEPIYGFYESNNFYFGMYVWADFYQPKDGIVEPNEGHESVGDQPMVFKFNGDDDMWVFIDGVLVLDLGGIHDAQSGEIDFSTGQVKWTDTRKGEQPNWKYSTLKDLYAQAGKQDSVDWDGNTFANGTNHRIQIFYMERGAGASNLKISFNLKTIPDGQLAVRKNVENYYAPQLENITYTMKVTVNDQPYANQPYTIFGTEITGQTDQNGYLVLKNGQTAVFSDLTVNDVIVVEEVGASDTPTGSEIADRYDITCAVTDSAGNPVGGASVDGGKATATMPGYGSITVGVVNTAKFTRPLKIVKYFSGTEGNQAPRGFEATYTIYEVIYGEDGNIVKTPVGDGIKYSEMENGEFVFWLDTNKTYTVEESFGDGDEKGETDELKWADVSLSTNDPALGTDVSQGTVTLDVTDATLETESQENPVDTITLTNIYGETEVDITVTKVDSSYTDKKLAGAQFHLKNSEGRYYKYEVESADGRPAVSWVDSIDDSTLLESDENGTFPIFGLNNGQYTLEERKAPDGYQLPTSVVTFTVADGKVTAASDGNVISYGEASLLVGNSAGGPSLPETGGPGTTFATIGGIALVAAAGCGYGLRRSRERRGDQS